MHKKLDFPSPMIRASPYMPCWVCVMGWRGVFNNKPHKFCGTPETTQCGIAKRFLSRHKMQTGMEIY